MSEKIKLSEEKRLGWEVARDVEKYKTSIMDRLIPEWRHVKAGLGGAGVFFVIFLIGIWLSGNPLEATQRIQSDYIIEKGIASDGWTIIWTVVLIAAFFEFMDASAGMGFGTALSPLLLVMGLEPLQIVPVIMIQQAVAGLVGALLHQEFENVEWVFRPMSETVKLALIVILSGVLVNITAIVGVYKIFTVETVWIKLYVAILLAMMGGVSIFQAKRERPYRPFKMVFWACLAGFNKGVGGGGYGPVVTVGGLLSGVPVKSMLAVTAIGEGCVSTVALITWIFMLASGITIDYVLLPSVMLATIFSAVAAPYMTRVFPEKLWKIVIPGYCLCLTVYAFWKIVPDVVAKMSG